MCLFRSFADVTPNALTFLAESPMVLCGIIPKDWLQDNMAEILWEKPDGGWSSKLGRSLTVPELRSLLILRYEVRLHVKIIQRCLRFKQLIMVCAGAQGETELAVDGCTAH